VEVKLVDKKTTSSRPAAIALAKQQHMAVREFLNQEPTSSDLLANLIEEKGEGDELTLLEILLKGKKPISAKNIGMPKATVSKAARQLNEHLMKNFSNTIEPLKAKRIKICVRLKESKGGLSVGYHLACYNTKTKKYLEGTATKKLFKSLWADFIKNKLTKRLEQEATDELLKKLKRRNDYQRLSMEIGIIEKNLQQHGNQGSIEFETPEASDHNRIWKSFNIDSLLESGGTYIITVDVGGGKTTFLRHLQTEILQKTHLIPILLDASEIEQWKPEDTRGLAEKLAKKFRLKIHENKVIDFLLEVFEKDIILLIDGLDQIKGGEYQELVEDTILKLTDGNVIIASRPSAVINLENEKKFTFLRLKPFDTNAQKNYFGDNFERAKQLSINASNLIAIPMLAHMVRMLIEEKQDGNINNRAELYEKFIGYILTKYKHGKAKLSPGLRTQIRISLEKIAYDALAEKEPHIQKIPLDFCYDKDRLPDNSTERNDELLAKSGLVNLIIERSGWGDKDFLFFTHQSFQEYLATEYIKDSDELVGQVLKEKWNPKWKEVIKFLVGIRGKDVIEKILDEKDNPIHSKLFLAAELVPETKTDHEFRKMMWLKFEELGDCLCTGSA